MYSNRGLHTDYYELTMAQGYFNAGIHRKTVTFELFFRSNPFDGGYAIATGIYDAIQFIQNYHFSDSDISYLKSQNIFQEEFLLYLKELKFIGEVVGVPEGTIVFPYEPILLVTGPLIITQLIESALLNIINFQSLIATKAARVCLATKRQDNVLEFGLRRAHGDAAFEGAKAAIIGGCVATSNTLAGKLYGLPVSGTHAHSWIQSFPKEIDAFRSYAKSYPQSSILLVDTYDVIRSGVPNAIQIAKELRAQGSELQGIRIDSGDLAWLSIKSAELLDLSGFPDVKIVLSSDIDEYVIESIINQILNGSNNDEERILREKIVDRLLWGVGTKLITGAGTGVSALNGVYKLVEVEHEPVIKISEDRFKMTNPGKKKLWRILNSDRDWLGDVIGLYDADTPKEGDIVFHVSDFTKYYQLGDCVLIPLHIDLIAKYGNNSDLNSVWQESKNRVQKQIQELDKTHLRFMNPHIYRVSITDELNKIKNDFLDELSQ